MLDLDAPNPLHRRLACRRLARHPHPAARRPLETLLLYDPKVSVRVAAALALRALGSPESLPTLLIGLRDPEPTVRDLAGVALSELGPAVLDEVKALRVDPDPRVAFTASLVIARIENRSARWGQLAGAL